MSYQVQPISITTPVVGPNGNGMAQAFHRWLISHLTLTKISGVPLYGIVMYSLTTTEEGDYFDADGIGITGTPWAGWAQCNGQTLSNGRVMPVIAAAAIRIY